MELNLRKNKLATATLLGSMLASGYASAGPIVTQWSFSTEASFSGVTFGSGSGSTTASDYELSWGSASGNFQNPTSNANNNRSAMTIGTSTTKTGGAPATGSVNTTIGGTPSIPAGQVGLGTSFTHWNNPISGSFSTLLSGIVNDSLTLTPVLPAAGPAVSAPDLTFNFEFRETPNDGPCAGGTLAPCGDLFGFAGTPNLNLPFTYDDVDYFASIFVLGENFSTSPIAFLNDAQCAALGFTTGPSGKRCQGFLTAEEAFTTVQFGFAITTDRITINVPEPGTLALFSLAVAGLGFSRRKNS
ncbi:MAG: PEP-CTERM sorting domain-containing protein [Hahellaceae bacterium]|jgi:hypothetical protein|nr:PEP-CTERM sorting domain-containing protein [Hahellaceae bacterium]MCP5210938.1 PEP-CTERM sorting domain-containing protein [Hahellaceae bacterium]